jgi:manganese/zinc/iron transport system permease protein
LAEILTNLIFDYTLRTIALGAAVLGAVSGALGSFALLKRQSLLGDAISHAALPGIALAFLLTGTKSPIVLLLGAAFAGWVGTMFIMRIVRSTRIKEDGAMGLVLSVFFGFGLVLLTFIQKLPTAAQAGLDKFLFGQAATLLVPDVIVMAVLGTVSIILMIVFWKELKLLTFDADYTATLGFSVRFLDILLITLIVIAIVIGLQTVGVVLMSAMIVAPAAASRQWTDRLSLMVGLAALFGALNGVLGAVISSSTTRLPTGPTIVLCLTVFVLLSLFFAPNRGLFWGWIRDRRNRRLFSLQSLLRDFYTLAEKHADRERGHPEAVFRTMEGSPHGVSRGLEALAARGWIRRVGDVEWILTPEGMGEVRALMKDQGEKS